MCPKTWHRFTINAKSNIKAVVIKGKVREILRYILGVILIINLIIVIFLIYKGRKELYRLQKDKS